MKPAAMLSLVIWFAAVCTAAAPPANNSAITGVWKGKMEGLPAVTLNVEEEGGKLRGAVLFFLILRNPGSAPSASAGIPEPLIEPSFDGKTLTFKVSHRYAHPPRTLKDPPVSFHLELTEPDKAKLLDHDAPALEMIRDVYK
jgi:hypothetical protein